MVFEIWGQVINNFPDMQIREMKVIYTGRDSGCSFGDDTL